MKVLVVDDDAVSARVVEAVLKRIGHEVVLLDQALGAMSTIARDKPDVALIDVNMPGLGGDRLAKVLVAMHPGLPVYLHSSLPASELEKIARASGATGFLKKGGPVEFARAFTRLMDARATVATAHRSEK
jgi:CheY-like chemotaxis protein